MSVAIDVPAIAWAMNGADSRMMESMAMAGDDGFGYHDVERMIEVRRSLGLRCDRDFVHHLVDGTHPSVRPQELGLLTPEEAAEEEIGEALAADAAVIVAYGAEHPETWAGLHFGREGMEHVLVASFAGDLDEHRSRLTPLVRRHDRLRLRRLAFSKQELEQVRAEITAEGLDDVKQVGIGDGAVDVGLAARAEVLAAEWHLRYGSALRIHVGNLPYPPTAARPPVDIPRSTTTLEGVELRVVFDPPEVASGEHIHGQLV